MIKKYLQNNLFSFLLVVIFVSFFILTIGLAWTEPTAAPPGGNVSAPLNVGPTGQVKSGGLMLNTGGAPIGLIVAQGKVGIGTTTPGAKLDVVGGYIRSNIGFCIGGSCITSWPTGGGGGGGISGSGTTNYIAKWTDSTSLGNSIIYDNGTNVGIGTTAPGAKLDVVGGYIRSDTGFCIGGSCITSWPTGGGGGGGSAGATQNYSYCQWGSCGNCFTIEVVGGIVRNFYTYITPCLP
jgi:hypothetical protein